jgi:hypothetical protein
MQTITTIGFEPGRHRGLRLVSLLVARTPGTRPYRAINAAGLREALRQAAEERCC